MSISSEQISVVVQGQVDSKTKSVLTSIRSSFPESQIILSTWEISDVGDLDFDEVVFSKDVGESSFPNMMDKSNVNRQIVSTKAGVELAKREYILKTRTDILFENSNFLNIYESYMNSGVSWQKRRIAICNYYSRNPRMFPLSYHPSDWLTFG